MYEYEIDETKAKDAKKIKRFLKEYKALCKKYGCLVVSDGGDVEACCNKELANEPDPWGVESQTKSRGWKI